MANLNELELQNLRHLIGAHSTIVSFKNEKVTDFAMMLDAEMCQDALLKKGKKSFIKIQVK